MRDKLFNDDIDIADFRFDDNVVKVFDDMVKRSVPGYESMIQMVGLVARMHGKDNTNYYDLGSSTGAITLAIALNNNHKNNQFIAIDNSPEMVNECQKNLSSKIKNLKVFCSDVNDIEIENASIVVLNLTLQFIDINSREMLSKNIKLKLTEKEINTINYLFKSNKPVSIDELQEKVWSYQSDIETHTVETHIYRLRKKISITFNDNEFIISKKNGYQIE